MKALYSTLVASIVLLTVEAFLCVGAARAQGDAPDCEFCVKGTAYDCLSASCSNTLGCNTVNFTVPCEARYWLTALVVCSDPYNCKYCWACANLYCGQQFVGNGHTSCQPNDCEQDQPEPVDLKPNTTYTLYVCKVPCTGYGCGVCPSSCRAVGYVYYEGSSCPSP